MGICRATKRNGEPCTAPATERDGHCWAHSPAHSEERRRNASRAGRSKPSRDLATIKAQLQDMADQVLSGALDRGAAAVAGQLLNIKLRALEIERKVRELEAVEERLAALEEQQEARRWGA
jgi:hypothetical protein